MSLLSNPEARPNRWAQHLVRLHGPACLLLCLAGYIWLCLLAHSSFNNTNYFSENALLPGLVQSDFVDDGTARRFFNELQDEIRENYHGKDSIPIPWIAAKMHQINLDVYTHNFTLHYPLGKGQTFKGDNVYGILRAGRSASTEALVLSAPYRPPTSQHRSTNAGIALMLAFAKFARSRKYWAKDIIFLITEHEQLGAQAWLEAYHGVESTDNDIRLGPFYQYNNNERSHRKILDAGNLKGRAGAIQAAINLELPSLAVKYIEIKVEGLNGQLPNLDLVNLVHKMCIKSSVHHAYKNSYSWVKNQGPWKNWKNSLKTLFSMITTQLTGVPTGNHGLFHQYGIEAITMEGIEAEAGKKGKSTWIGGRPAHALEGTLRSLNNLLERFHQSFFFYLRPATDRFVSIGQYMPTLGVLTGALFIRAFAIWLMTQQTDSKKADKSEARSRDDSNSSEETIDDSDNEIEIEEKSIGNKLSLSHIVLTYLITHLIGYGAMRSPQIISEIGVENFNIATEEAIYYGLLIVSVFLIVLLPFIINSFRKTEITREELLLLNILALLELATFLLSVGMHNFSLGYCLAAVYAPFALMVVVPINSEGKISRIRSLFMKFTWLLLHPLILSTIVVYCFTFVTFPDESLKDLIHRGLKASQQAVMFSIVDGMIYGNWLFGVVMTTLFPTWMLFWQIMNTKVVN